MKSQIKDIRILSTFTLKMIAVITMTIDHIGAVLLPQYLILRVIGRLAFPIYSFLVVNGFRHTKDVKKYIIRLGSFAIISEIFFDLAAYGKIFYVSHQNVFFTLTIGLVMITLIDNFRQGAIIAHRYMNMVTETVIVLMAGMIATLLSTDYSFCGILMIYGFYTFECSKMTGALWQMIINIVLIGGIQSYAIVALPFIYLYNGKSGIKCKWLFYIYYPAHLLVLYIIQRVVGLYR